MLTEVGRVVAVEADGVWVETIRTTACDSCAAKSGCGQGTLGRALGRQNKGLIKALESESLSAADCALDDYVEIALPEDVVLKGSAVVYLVPLMLGLIGAVVGGDFGDAGAVAGFALGLAAGFTGVRWFTVNAGKIALLPTLVALKSSSRDHIPLMSL